MSIALYDSTDVDRRVRTALERSESVFLIGAAGCGLSTYLERLQNNPPKGVLPLRIDLRRHSSLVSAVRDLIRQSGLERIEDSSLEAVALALSAEQRRKPVVMLDHLDALDDSNKVKLLTDARNLQGRGKGDGLHFVLTGSVNPKRLNQLIRNSPVENRSNRLQLPPLAFAEIDRVIDWHCEQQLLDKRDLREALRRKLFDLAGDELPLLRELVQALPYRPSEVRDLDAMLKTCVDEVLRETDAGRALLSRLQRLDDNHFRTLAYVLSGWSPEMEASWYHASEEHVDLCVLGVLQRMEDGGRLRFRSELVPALLVNNSKLRERLRQALNAQDVSFEAMIAFHQARSHSLGVAFHRCHQIELILRQFMVGLALRLGKNVIEDALLSIRADIPRGVIAAFRRLPEVERLPDEQKSARTKEYIESLRQEMGMLHDELRRRRSEGDGDNQDGALGLLSYLSVAEVAAVIGALAKSLHIQGGPQVIRDALQEIIQSVEEFRPLRNRVAHHRALSLHEHQRLSNIQQRLSQAMFRIGALINKP